MSLGNYIYSIFSGQETQEAKNGIDMAPTPYLSYALTANGFSSGSVLNLGALTLGTVKIVFGYTIMTILQLQDQHIQQQNNYLIKQNLIIKQKLSTSTIRWCTWKYRYFISTDGVIVPTPGGQNTGNSEPALLEAVQPELPAAEQSIVLYDAVDVNNSTGNNEVTLMALTVEEPDPIEPNLVEPIPPGEYEAITDSEFTNNITAERLMW